MAAVPAYIVMAAIVVVFAALAWTKPECASGTVASMAWGNGWVCLSGYKP